MRKREGKVHFLDEADYYESIMDACQVTQSDLAKKIGVSQSTVANSIRLLELSPMIRQIIRENGLNMRIARELLRLPTEGSRAEALMYACENSVRIADFKYRVDRLLNSANDTDKKRSVRSFIRILKWSVSILNENGIKAEIGKTKNDELLEIIVRIPKK